MPDHLDNPGENYPDIPAGGMDQFPPGPDFLPGNPSGVGFSLPDTYSSTHAFGPSDQFLPPVMRHRNESSGHSSDLPGHGTPDHQAYQQRRTPYQHIIQPGGEEPDRSQPFQPPYAHPGSVGTTDAENEPADDERPAASQDPSDDPFTAEAEEILAGFGLGPLGSFDPGHRLMVEALAATLAQNADAAQTQVIRIPPLEHAEGLHPLSPSEVETVDLRDYAQVPPPDNTSTVDYGAPLVGTPTADTSAEAPLPEEVTAKFYQNPLDLSLPLPVRRPERPADLDDLDRLTQQDLADPPDTDATAPRVQAERLPQRRARPDAITAASRTGEGPEAVLADMETRLAHAQAHPELYTEGDLAYLAWQLEFFRSELHVAPPPAVDQPEKEVTPLEYGKADDTAQNAALEAILKKLKQS